MGWFGLDSPSSGYGPVGGWVGSCQDGNEFLGSTECCEITEEVNDCWLLKD
jgi:hypothetical protein